MLHQGVIQKLIVEEMVGNVMGKCSSTVTRAMVGCLMAVQTKLRVLPQHVVRARCCLAPMR